MKLKTKLTALCAALLFAVAVSLTAAMLWQVREQSYEALLQSTEETLNDLVDDFGTAVYRSSTDGLDSLSRKVLLTYCFRSCSVPGSALVVNGECLSASAQIDPERYLDVHYGGTQSARACAGGRHFLILGRVTDVWGMDCSVYLAADATYIYSQLWQLSGRFALLALTIGLAGCGGSSKGGSPASSASKNKLDGDGMTASSTQEQEYEEPEDVTYMRLLAGEDEYRACVLYLGGSYEVTTDVQKVLDSQTDLRDLWGFVYDIPQDHWVVAPDGGCDLYCIFPQDPDATLFVYETSLTDDAENPLQRGKQLYYSEDGQPILLLCNISDIAPNTEVELYPSTGEELVFSPFLSGENGHVVEAEGVCDFTIYPEGDDWETTTSPWSLEGNWLETGRDTDEGYFDTDPADADRMCFLPTDADTEGSQLPLTASYITPYPELNVEEADLFYQEGTPEVPFRSNQEWYATFTGEDGSRYAVTLEDEDTLALKFYLDGGESYLSLVNTVYFARQEAMG